MPHPASTSRRAPWPLLSLALAAAALCAPARAAEPAAHGDKKPLHAKAEAAKSDVPKADAAAHGKPETKADPKAESRPEPKVAAKAAAAQDPLDVVRERLAAKLGATKAPDTRSPHVVQVASRATGEFQVSSAARPVTHRAPARAAGHGPGAAPAAAHRDASVPAGHQGGSHGGTVHWAYQGETGPQAWGSLKPEFVKCSTGTRQSPIDIRDGFPVDLEPVKFGYRPSGFSVVDNGHTVQVDVSPGNTVEVMGRVYELVQFHFHRPSEERINGRAFDMVAHLVHKDVEGRLAVVAVLLDRGSAQPVIQTVWNNLPLEKGEPNAARGAIDLNELLPAERRYFTYMGSLTTPPCSEGVLWMVMQQPVTISPEQINLFARLYPMNARPVQSASGRMIKQSN